MMADKSTIWQPQEILRAVHPTHCSMGTVEVVTDQGPAYVKPLGGCKDGPHPLACELVGSELAEWFGLPLPPFALLNIDDLGAEIIRAAGGHAEPGPAFASRKVPQAVPWDGSAKSLAKVENTDIIPQLVVFDTWTLN